MQIRLDDGDPIDVPNLAPLLWSDDAPDEYVWPIIDRSTDSLDAPMFVKWRRWPSGAGLQLRFVGRGVGPVFV